MSGGIGVFVIAVFALAAFSRGFRWLLAAAAVVAIVGLGFIFRADQLDSERAQAQRAANAQAKAVAFVESLKRVSPSEVNLTDGEVSPNGLLRIRLHNKSSFTVTGAELSLALSDCVAGACDVIDRGTALISSSVPPAEARDVEAWVRGIGTVSSAGDLRPRVRGVPQWQWTVTSVTAE